MTSSVIFICPGCRQPIGSNIASTHTTATTHTTEPIKETGTAQDTTETQQIFLPQTQWEAHRCGRDGCLFNPLTIAQDTLDLGKIKKEMK